MVCYSGEKLGIKFNQFQAHSIISTVKEKPGVLRLWCVVWWFVVWWFVVCGGLWCGGLWCVVVCSVVRLWYVVVCGVVRLWCEHLRN